MDYAAAELGIDRFELRRRNFIKAKEMPFATPAGTTYDCGDFPGLFKEALERADVKGFKQRKRESKRNGKLRGLGVGCFVETTAAQTTEMGGIRFNADGTVTIVTGTLDYGQGHASAFAQVLVEKLGVPFDRIQLLQGDSDQLVTGGGTGGSRSAMLSGTAIMQASDKVIEHGKQLAAHVLEASAGDIEFKSGRFTIAGTDRSIGIMELAQKLRSLKLPEGLPTTLDVTHVTEPVAGTYPNGVHVVEVEIEPDTGLTRTVKYTVVNDFGTVLNPMLVEGQVQGGAIQGLGQVLLEERGLRRRRATGHRLVHGLRHAARARRADDRGRQPSGSDQDQSGRRQRLRRSRHVGRAARGRQRGDRCAVRIRHPPPGNADDPGAHLAGDPGRAGKTDRVSRHRAGREPQE